MQMGKKMYEKPATIVVRIQHTEMLLVTSDQIQSMGASRSGYGQAEEDEWE